MCNYFPCLGLSFQGRKEERQEGEKAQNAIILIWKEKGQQEIKTADSRLVTSPPPPAVTTPPFITKLFSTEYFALLITQLNY